MKKRKNPNKIDCVPVQNLVAKFARQFNKAHIFEDKSKYQRNSKHRKQEASLITLPGGIREASCFFEIMIHNLQFNMPLFNSKIGFARLLLLR